MARTGSPPRMPWLLASALLVSMAIFALASPQNRAWNGLTFDNKGVVTQVADGGPGEHAGIATQDRIVSIDGVAISDRVGRLKQVPAGIGESRTLRVEQNGVERDIRLTLAALPAQTFALFLGAAAIGGLFLVCGIRRHLERPSGTTRLMAVLGLVALPALTPPFPLSSEGARALLIWLLVSTGVAIGPLLVQIVLSFPDRPLRKSLVGGLLYAPVALFSALAAAAIFAVPGWIGTVFVIGAVLPALSAVAVLIISLVRWRRAQDPARRSALAILFAGLLMGIVPVLVGAFATSLPGAGGYFLTMAAVPLALMLGQRRGSEAQVRPRAANSEPRIA